MRNMKKALAAVAAVATLASLAACGGSDGGNDAKANAGDADKADLVFWGWDTGNTMKALIADFEKANPGITVKFNNTGTASDTQTALSNAVAAGKGAPDVVMLEDPTVTQFAVTGDLVDLTAYGADKLEDDFSAGPWSKLQYDGKPYALPIDSGPEVFFYNDAVLKKAGVDGSQIKTWDDYYEAAKKVKAIGAYMTNNSGSSMEYQPFTAQAWQAGAQPWKVDGENITIDMTKDSGMKKYIEFQQKLIDEDLVDTKIANWSDDWNRALNEGDIATLTIGAWMPVNLMNGAPDWEGETRFYLPNEDAEVARDVLSLLPVPPHRPLFVTGSGMLALDMIPSLPGDARIECVDLSPFQKTYLEKLCETVRGAKTSRELREWLKSAILPELNAFYARRGSHYSFENVISAMRSFFRVRFFFDDEHLARVREGLDRVHGVTGDMVARVGQGGYDFVHLSNIVDYLTPFSLGELFSGAARYGAPLFFIQTTACPSADALEHAWKSAGYEPCPENRALCEKNLALGTLHSMKPWMRSGRVCLLFPRGVQS